MGDLQDSEIPIDKMNSAIGSTLDQPWILLKTSIFCGKLGKQKLSFLPGILYIYIH